MSDAPSPRKRPRSTAGCETCRARKVRCDDRPGTYGCLQCERLGLPCSRSASSPNDNGQRAQEPASTATTDARRKRTFRSCTGCRSNKTRCSGDKPACSRCKRKSLQCQYEGSSEPAWQQHLRLTKALQPQGPLGSLDSEDRLPVETAAERTHHSEAGSGPHVDVRSTTDERMAERSPRPTVHQPDEESSWLRALRLPEKIAIRVLVEFYFRNIHPLRCFGFLHKPSFMQRIDREDAAAHEDDALLHIVCALGALFYAAEHGRRIEPPSTTLAAGSRWARTAQQLILSQMGNIKVENLMAAVLLHDYELRMANFANAFMLSGLTARMAQALQINLEHSNDILCRDTNSSPSASTKESRRRLLWSCYIIDSLVGSGVDQLTLIKEPDIKIQLPCNERNFLLETPCITEVLEPGHFLKFLDPASLPSYPSENIGVRAYYLRYMSIRRRVLMYVLLTLEPLLENQADSWHPKIHQTS